MDRLSWGWVAEGYGRHLRTTGKLSGTVRTNTSDVRIYWKWCADRELSVWDVDRPLFQEWLAGRVASVSASRAHGSLCSLRLLYEWAMREGWCQADPTQGLKIKKGKTLPTEPLDRKEIDLLLEHACHERDKLMLLVLVHTGVRISELAGMNAEDVNWQTGVTLIRGKGNKERWVVLNPDLLGRMKAYYGLFPSGALWLSQQNKRRLASHQIRKIIYGIGASAEVTHVHPHRFRATMATEFIEQYKDIQALQGLLGHESIETTSRYSEWTRQRRGLEMMKRFTLPSLSASSAMVAAVDAMNVAGVVL